MNKFIFIILILSQLVIAGKQEREHAYCNHGHVAVPELFEQPKLIWDIKFQTQEIKNIKKSFSKNFKAKDFKIGMKILFISATKDEALEPSLSLIRVVFESLGVPYEHLYLTQDGERDLNKKIELFDHLGNPKYYGLIFSTSDLVFQSSSKGFVSALTPEERIALNNYQEEFNVRKISLFSFPNPAIGVKYHSEISSVMENEIISDEVAKKFDPSLNEKLIFPISQHWHYEASSLANEIKVSPYLKYKDNNLAAVISTFPSGREEMHFFFAQSQYTKMSLVLSASWVNWLTKGLYIGKRRIFFNAQIDDLFLETDLWNPHLHAQIVDGSYIYRTAPDDLEFFANWQKSYLRPVTQDPSFKIEPAFNGQGIWKYGGYVRDGLFHTVRKLKDEFHWLSHTYTHPDLNYVTHDYAYWELAANREITKDLFGSEEYPTYSKNSMVTPKISGLFNPGALRAIFENEIYNVTGDNTRKELVESLFWGHFTTTEKHGFDGVYIIPRHSTVVYYNVSHPAELADEYNSIYFNHFGRNSNFEEIIEREVDRVSRYLLNYEPSPYMFHQANLRSFPWKGGRHTLLGIWMEEIIKELRKFHQLPILSKKMTDLSQYMRERLALNNCHYEAKILVKSGQFKEIELDNPELCSVPFTSLNFKFDVNYNEGLEIYGPDKTITVKDSILNIKL